MTEGSVPRMKRNGARLFKNPPQPHMCIQDFIQGTAAPCYVNVLSWDKIAMPRRPSLPVPLYGGMRVPPPRTKTEAIVFAVMANPEVLRMNGKNAQDPKKRMSFIELLLDFIEAMNAGVIFTRRYAVLKDRDITGELKEVWNAVLAIRDSEQRPPQQETWIDAQPSMSQYPQYLEQQQQQQEYTPQPPQYHSTIAYGTISGENMHYDGYGRQSRSPVVPNNEPIFISGNAIPQQYHGNVRQVTLDTLLDRNKDNLIIQSAIRHHQFYDRQTWPQYVNTKYMHPNSNLPHGPVVNTTTPMINPSNPIKSFPPYSYQQQQPQQQPHMDSAMHVDIRRMQPQQQQPPMHMNHVQPPYEQPGFNVQNNAHRAPRPHMGVVQKNNVTKRQANSPTHISCTNCQTKDEQSIRVLQRETPTERRDMTNHVENNKTPAEKAEEPKTVPVTDLDEDLKKNDEFVADYTETSTEKKDVDSSESARTVDNTPSCEENSTKTEKLSSETKTEVTIAEQPTGQKNPNKLARARKALTNISDKHNSVASESPKRSQPTMNIIKSVFKINPGASGEETAGKKKANGQTTKTANGRTTCENEEQVQQGYTILKKEAQEEIVSEIAQISIQDCKDATEVGPVLS
ncbi:probable basic-leucine zipper transcription factor Q [Linepithema humile]|uniref:probable basic-leucine zipper transcription factor Q n=1 Tax=Linepithema humile TaxID=83485 RepID=UPI00062397E4|nr:PREDICTED: myb-like protein AA [Linepithema humile]